MDNAALLQRIGSQFPSAILAQNEFRGDLSLTIHRDSLLDVARLLYAEPALAFTFLENLCGVDYLGRDPRFEVVYHLLSITNGFRCCLKVGAPEADPTVPSVTSVWATANWHEREAFDLLGILFAGHPSLDRILLPVDWEGHPLRKDVPLGNEEVAFSINRDRIYAQKPFARQ